MKALLRFVILDAGYILSVGAMLNGSSYLGVIDCCRVQGITNDGWFQPVGTMHTYLMLPPCVGGDIHQCGSVIRIADVVIPYKSFNHGIFGFGWFPIHRNCNVPGRLMVRFDAWSWADEYRVGFLELSLKHGRHESCMCWIILRNDHTAGCTTIQSMHYTQGNRI